MKRLKKKKNKNNLTQDEILRYGWDFGVLCSKLIREQHYDANDFYYQLLNSKLGGTLAVPDIIYQVVNEEGYLLNYIQNNLNIIPAFREYKCSICTAGLFYIDCILLLKLKSKRLWRLVPFNVLDALYEDVISQYGVGLSMKEIDEWRSGKWGKLEVDFYSKDGWDASLLKKSSVFTD